MHTKLDLNQSLEVNRKGDKVQEEMQRKQEVGIGELGMYNSIAVIENISSIDYSHIPPIYPFIWLIIVTQ